MRFALFAILSVFMLGFPGSFLVVGGNDGGAPDTNFASSSILLNDAGDSAFYDCGAAGCLASDLNIGIDYTLEFWVRCTTLAASDRRLIQLLNTANALRGEMQLNDASTTGRIRWQVFDSSTSPFGSSVLTVGGLDWYDDAWRHVAMVHDTSENDGQVRLYVDGTDEGLLSSGNNTINSNIDKITWGHPSVDPSNCRITEFRKWSTARTTTQIQNHDLCQLSCVDDTSCAAITGLDWYVPFTEGTGTAANDNASAADFTLSSAALWDSSVPAFTNDGSNDCYDGT